MMDILKEKISIVDGMKDNSILIVNGDDPLLESWVMEHHNRISIWYVASEHNVGRLERDGVPVFWAEHVHVDREKGLSFIGRSWHRMNAGLSLFHIRVFTSFMPRCSVWLPRTFSDSICRKRQWARSAS